MSGRCLARAAVIFFAVLSVACAGAPAASPGSGLHDFEGTWTASGTRRTLPLGGGRTSSVIELEGSMLLSGAGRPGVGFRSEIVALVDSASGLTGRGVWTDERGDQVFSELTGTGTAARNSIEGTIVGGTGRYAGATGTYTFSWQYMIESDDGEISGRAVELKGSVRVGAPPGNAP